MAKRSRPPLAVLREAIISQDWAAASAAYTGLTGEVLGEAKPSPAGKGKSSTSRKTKPAAKPLVTPEFEAAAEAEAAGGVLLAVPAPAPSKGSEATPRQKRYAVAASAAPAFKNNWVPPKASARELSIDRKLLKGVEPEERGLRGEYDTSADALVKVTCGKCGRDYRCRAWEANRTVDGEPIQNRCEVCSGR